MTLSRRGLLGGLFVAPAIVRASNIMRVIPVRNPALTIVHDSIFVGTCMAIETPNDILADIQAMFEAMSRETQIPSWMLLGQERLPT